MYKKDQKENKTIRTKLKIINIIQHTPVHVIELMWDE